jgi:hypothetical protein
MQYFVFLLQKTNPFTSLTQLLELITGLFRLNPLSTSSWRNDFCNVIG